MRMLKLGEQFFELRGEYEEQLLALAELGERFVVAGDISKWCIYYIFDGDASVLHGASVEAIKNVFTDGDAADLKWEYRGTVSEGMNPMFGCMAGEALLKLIYPKGWLGTVFHFASPSGGSRVDGDFVLAVKPTEHGNSFAKVSDMITMVEG